MNVPRATTVKDGVAQIDPTKPLPDPDEVVTCDKCGRKFYVRFKYCICRG